MGEVSPTLWFKTEGIHENLYRITEQYFFEGNRCNIWLVKGPERDVIIDSGLGVCDLKQHLESLHLIDPPPGGTRDCTLICTHNHFDHSGGARHFDNVLIHQNDLDGLRQGRQTETLNYVKTAHFYRTPYPGFSACKYAVPPTECKSVQHGDRIELGQGDYLEVIHVPGHTKGSIMIFYPMRGELFSGDFVYDCGPGSGLFDWLPTSCVTDYVQSARDTIDWLMNTSLKGIYPGHFRPFKPQRMRTILQEYVEAKDQLGSKCCASCLQATTWAFFLLGCFRCCPCG
ncbi:metallo-beta-lactamase domain-containing protein 2 [Lingula anatina]|uniref:Metallo-beta-lactamase domain-containing protein 2 n=1 Tax=Lingula anatina TaxID=7574 RepID=A0A1S3I6U1_LINAN|nr:metallo-beta-lactamase domain-containing protein 2 [Lingula anatina]|eukprot:XP_013393928.1 metallo-beta-lactamase domain-containing protein 2 [Lingula anatina]